MWFWLASQGPALGLPALSARGSLCQCVGVHGTWVGWMTDGIRRTVPLCPRCCAPSPAHGCLPACHREMGWWVCTCVPKRKGVGPQVRQQSGRARPSPAPSDSLQPAAARARSLGAAAHRLLEVATAPTPCAPPPPWVPPRAESLSARRPRGGATHPKLPEWVRQCTIRQALRRYA